MSRYHINPATGEPGICRATKVCPFGDLATAHYSSKTEARHACEAAMVSSGEQITAQDIAIFSEGDCDVLALEIHRRTGWPLVSMCFKDEATAHSEGYPTPPFMTFNHHFVRLPNGNFLDVEGESTEAQMMKKWGSFVEGRDIIREISAEDLAKSGLGNSREENRCRRDKVARILIEQQALKTPIPPSLQKAIGEYASSNSMWELDKASATARVEDLSLLKLPNYASGRCQMVATDFTSYVKARGIEAETVQEDDEDPPYDKAFGYNDRSLDPGFGNHFATVVHSGRDVYTIDWTASQFGYREFPRIQKLLNGRYFCINPSGR